MKTTEIENSQDIIDSRDVIARIEYLESEQQSIMGDAEHIEDMDEDARKELLAWEADYAEELDALRALADEASGSPDWQHGEALIRDSYFQEYAEQLAEDCCDMPKDLRWPLCHIDWEAAAQALKQDYTSVDFAGVDYWIRS